MRNLDSRGDRAHASHPGAWRPAARLCAPAALMVLAAGTALAAPAAASAAVAGSAHWSPVVGHVYVNDNTEHVNTIAAFSRHANGRLTPEHGSPFRAGGAGTGVSLASQGALQLARHGRLLLAVDAGSNQISVLRIRHNGSLCLVRVVPSRGNMPVSIAVHGSLVYVANAGPRRSNYTGFWLSRRGRMKHLRGSTVWLPKAAQPGDVLFNGTGRKLIGTRVGTSKIDSFIVRRSGRLRAAAGSPFSAQGTGPFGSEFRPASPGQLFVSNAHNGTGLGTISAFRDSRRGHLTSVHGSPFPNHQTAPCWVVISHGGRYLFAVNTGSGTISRFAIAGSGRLSLLGSTPIRGSGGVGAVDPGLSPNGRFLFVNESTANKVGAFAVQGGHLRELRSSPTRLPHSAAAAGMVVT